VDSDADAPDFIYPLLASHVVDYYSFGSGSFGDRIPVYVIYSHPSMLALKPTQPPVQKVRGHIIGDKADRAGVDRLLLSGAEFGERVEERFIGFWK
jgi:hypothetical protein